MTASLRSKRGRCFLAATGLALLVAMACTPVAFLNNTTSLGRPSEDDDTPGQRGPLDIIFINNTPYRAIFTFGAYDGQDQNTDVQFEQFYVDPTEEETLFDRGLAGNDSTPRLPLTCARTFSIGGERLIQLIIDNQATRLSGGETSDAALREGVFFSDRPIDDPDANGENGTAVATADELVTLQGAEFECGSLLTYTFELDPDDPTLVNIDLTVVSP